MDVWANGFRILRMKKASFSVTLVFVLMLAFAPAVAAHEGSQGAVAAPWLPYAVGGAGLSAGLVLAVIAVALWRSA